MTFTRTDICAPVSRHFRQGPPAALMVAVVQLSSLDLTTGDTSTATMFDGVYVVCYGLAETTPENLPLRCVEIHPVMKIEFD
ncbi:MAG: hypothetical protein Udaeo2_32360 [Candidatus Udaeobacter sp.]|nr:MAG: hypothetical protein Udaeo2_32360 [Candidatus Udaeobacter sp.]